MHTIYFYKDENGNEPVLDYMRELASQKSKDSRIKLNKLNDYHFVKKTQKTPRREIEKAKRELKDLKERGVSDEE